MSYHIHVIIYDNYEKCNRNPRSTSQSGKKILRNKECIKQKMLSAFEALDTLYCLFGISYIVYDLTLEDVINTFELSYIFNNRGQFSKLPVYNCLSSYRQAENNMQYF